MFNWLTLGMVYAGSVLMVYNIYSYVCYARRIRNKEHWGKESGVLNIPIFLLVGFLFGYLAVGFFGRPDLIISGILFGGSIFVFIMVRLIEQITDRIQETEHLESELKAAEESSRAKTLFLSSVSHEMRTPLNAILGINAIALKKQGLSEETRGHLEKIRASAYDMLNLVSNVLDLSQIDSGNFTLMAEPFSLQSLVAELNALMKNRCDAAGLNYQPADTALSEDYYVGDETKIRQILSSLLGNAVKFTPAPGSVSFRVEQVSADADRRDVRFTVSDTGVGIDNSFLPHLYEVFAREDNGITSNHGGTGLGLAVSKKMIDLMNGEITVQTEKGVGSTFTVTIPLGVSDRKDEPPAAAEDIDDTIEENLLDGCRVLIVEDIDMNAEILADLLEMEGVSSERAENGKVAVDMFSRSEPGYYDAIFMDLRMPVMDGLEATRAIRALDRPDAGVIPILALTANAFDDDKRDTIEAGMNIHMAKPVDADSMYDILRRLIAQSRQLSPKTKTD